MTSKRRLRRKCQRKRAYDSLAEAEAVAARMCRETGDRLHGYPCDCCRFYHVGHIPRRVLQAMADRKRATI